MVWALTDGEIADLRRLLAEDKQPRTALQLLTPIEVDSLAAFARGLTRASSNTYANEQAGNAMTVLFGLSHYATTLQQLCARVSQLTNICDLLSPVAPQLSILAQTTPSESVVKDWVSKEIGALKNEMGQVVTAINESMATVQTVVDDLRKEHELVTLTRQIDLDPEFGSYA